MLETLAATVGERIKELEAFAQQSVGNHSAILGRLEEAKSLLLSIENAVSAAKEVADVISGQPIEQPAE